MSKHAGYKETKEKVIALKKTINPATGKLWTYRQIGVALGFTGQAAFYYVENIKGICPECLRKIK